MIYRTIAVKGASFQSYFALLFLGMAWMRTASPSTVVIYAL